MSKVLLDYSTYPLPAPMRRPVLLAVAPFLLIPYALASIAFDLMPPVDATASVTIAYGTLTHAQYMMFVLPIVLTGEALLLAGATAMMAERKWGRWLTLLAVAVSGLGVGAVGATLGKAPPFYLLLALARGAVLFFAVAWYLYFYPPVRRYYLSLIHPNFMALGRR